MSATGLLLFLIGVWIIINAGKLVEVVRPTGKLSIGLVKPNTGGGAGGGF
jgi:hypothetical protein